MTAWYRRLPHWQPESAWMFVTWRLWGSVAVKKKTLVTSTPGQAFAAMDRELDRRQSGPRWLTDSRVAAVVQDAFLAGQNDRRFYELRAWVIMPNHIHLLILPSQPLPGVTRWLKGSTARHANEILERTGKPFWRDESYDHWVRNPRELERIVRYIERNPVSAGLTDKIEGWPWSSTRWAGGSACPTAEPSCAG